MRKKIYFVISILGCRWWLNNPSIGMEWHRIIECFFKIHIHHERANELPKYLAILWTAKFSLSILDVIRSLQNKNNFMIGWGVFEMVYNLCRSIPKWNTHSRNLSRRKDNVTHHDNCRYIFLGNANGKGHERRTQYTIFVTLSLTEQWTCTAHMRIWNDMTVWVTLEQKNLTNCRNRRVAQW